MWGFLMFHKTLFISKRWVFCILFFSINGSTLQYSCLENPVDGGAWWATVHRVAQSQTRRRRLSMHACTGEGKGNPLQYSCLENPRDRGAWWAAIYEVAQSQTRLKQLSRSSSNTPYLISAFITLPSFLTIGLSFHFLEFPYIVSFIKHIYFVTPIYVYEIFFCIQTSVLKRCW